MLLVLNSRHRKPQNGKQVSFDIMRLKEYPNYGGRGITMDKQWSDSYEEFRAWALSAGYNPNAIRGKCTIDRIDVNGNYEPSNCRWVDMKIQRRNQRSSRKEATV